MGKFLSVLLLAGLLLSAPSGSVSADDMRMAVLLIPAGDVLARAYTPDLSAGKERTAGASKGSPEKHWRELASEDEDWHHFDVTFGRSWLFRSFTYKRIPPLADEGEVTGFKARADLNRCGTIESRWPAVNRGIETAAGFFSGSPLLLDREAFAKLSVLYGDPLPVLP